ncbi:hypothetical protein HHI36_008125 [Cryptolaemus montrouzieri]|uniref:Uncharacterized protein n=1 Tax=Cryptolaemus montrouzieri TaxID=559131 RepID=A0ABD2MRV0_9CUCU
MGRWFKSIDGNKISIHILNMYKIASHYMEEVSVLYGRILDLHFGQWHIYELLSAAEVAAIIEEAQLKLPSSLRILQTPILKTTIQHIPNEILIRVHFAVSEITSIRFNQGDSNFIEDHRDVLLGFKGATNNPRCRLQHSNLLPAHRRSTERQTVLSIISIWFAPNVILRRRLSLASFERNSTWRTIGSTSLITKHP